MMRTNANSWTAVLFLATCASACAGAKPSNADLDTATAALVEDHDKTEEAEQDVEEGLEQPLSGATAEDAPVNTSSEMAAADAALANPALYFKPAGCIQSARSGNVVTHVFSDCTGPHGRVHMTGTVASTWTKAAHGVQVVHATQGFHLNGAVIDHSVTLTYSQEGGVSTWTRTGTTTGITADGFPIRHEVNYTTTWEPEGRCSTRNGSSDTLFEDRAFSRQIDGYERCAVSLLGCPKAGTFTLVRPRLSVQLHFNGGRSYDLIINNRSFRDRAIAWCVEGE